MHIRIEVPKKKKTTNYTSAEKTCQLIPSSSLKMAILSFNREAERSREAGAASIGNGVLCPWPPRNSPVFAPLNAIMERCNDLLDLVQTVHDFR